MPESQNTESLFDIFYVDRSRLLGYLAQIDPNGTITSIKTTATDGEVSQAGGGVDIKILKGSVSTTDQSSDALERVFDPAMVLPFTVMSALDERNFISRNIATTPVGSLVICSGSMRIKDLTQAGVLWPIVEKQLPEIRINLKDESKKGANNVGHNTIKSIIQSLFKNMEHPIQAEIKSSNIHVWSTVKKDGLLSSLSDVGLKHGDIIPGEWHMLCIVDCIPGKPSELEVQTWSDSEPSFTDNLSDLFTSFRLMFGRPEHAYGVTPLIIFRKTNSITR